VTTTYRIFNTKEPTTKFFKSGTCCAICVVEIIRLVIDIQSPATMLFTPRDSPARVSSSQLTPFPQYSRNSPTHSRQLLELSGICSEHRLPPRAFCPSPCVCSTKTLVYLQTTTPRYLLGSSLLGLTPKHNPPPRLPTAPPISSLLEIGSGPV
jgi:hypothetical protein